MAAFATAVALTLLAHPGAGGAAEAVTLQLAGPATFEFAGYYAALWQGYYRDAGLDVTIRPGGMRDSVPIDPAREVAENRAQFGTGTTQLVIRRAQGLPVVLVTPIFQQSGAAVYYRSDSDFSSPAALVNARIGRLAASDILDIELATALRAEGIDPAKTKSVTVKADQIVTALADRTIDAAVGTAWTVPWQAHERGIVLKSFNPTNYRVEYYGDNLFTMERVAAAHPEIIDRFRTASLKGWEYALHHADDVISRLVADKPGEPAIADVAGFNRYQADVARRLARYPEVPLGYSNNDRWTQIEAGMIGAGALTRTADLANFVYAQPPEIPLRAHPASPTAPPLIVLFAALVVATLAWFGQDTLRKALLRIRLAARRSKVPNARRNDPEPPSPAPVETAARPVALPAPPSHTPPLPPLVNLNEVLAPLERRIRQRVRGKVRCRFSLLAELWPCRTEGGPVAAAVIDLVGAATAVMGSEGTLIVGTRNFAFRPDNLTEHPGGRLGEFARITVRDNGPGLTDLEFARILDPETTSRRAVANAAAMMERLGGFARVESAEDIGTAVHLYFARAESEIPREDMPAAQVAE
jgi:ABC-type nitrate/sulfonate/bicarbonate transport system substrate-binding protein